MILGNEKSICLVRDLLKEHNIKNLVISPGGTNAPLVKLVQNDEFFHCYSVVDERSASYFAIGVYLQTHNPVALICTSAQATRNYIPGLTEAFYKRVPILAITMEKHPRFKYQEYMQAPDQTSLPNDCIKKSYELPYISDINDIYHARRLINESILELTHNSNGPVQLCIPRLDFPIESFEPNNKAIHRYNVIDVKNMDLNNKKILIAVGEHLVFSDDEKRSIEYFCDNTNSVIYTNHLSNLKNKYTVNGNLLLSVINDADFEEIKPDILITIGGQTGDYPFYLRFSKTRYVNMEHWRISSDGGIVDTYDKLTCVFQGRESDFFNGISKNKQSHSYLDLWKNKIDALNKKMDFPFSNISIASYLHDKLPVNSVIQFSILNSLRTWDLFDIDSSIECYSNVGAFGIDGGMSTLIGQSIVTDKFSFMVIGDLAFLYDINSLGIKHIKNNLRILLINNNGGVEFKLHGEDKNVVDSYIAASNHFKNAKGWAETCGFKYLEAKNMEDFVKVSDEFTSVSDKPILLEAFVLDTDERDAYRMIIDANKRLTTTDKLKRTIKNCLGKETYEKLKKKVKDIRK